MELKDVQLIIVNKRTIFIFFDFFHFIKFFYHERFRTQFLELSVNYISSTSFTKNFCFFLFHTILLTLRDAPQFALISI